MTNHNRLWQDALAKEMKNVEVAYNVLEDHENVPVGWTKVSGIYFGKSRWTLLGKPDGSRTVIGRQIH